MISKMVTVKDRLAEILEEEPYIHLQIELAEQLGISREYVRQLVGELHLRHLLGVRIRKQLAVCSECGKTLDRHTPIKEGQVCRKCYYKRLEERKRTLICDWCGKDFKRGLSEVNASIKNKYKRSFCSQRCLGKWVGITYGFGVHKKTRRLEVKRKIEIEEVKRTEVPPRTVGKTAYSELLDRCIHLEGDQAFRIKCESCNHAGSVRGSLRRHFARLGINCVATSRTIGGNFYVFVWKKD